MSTQAPVAPGAVAAPSPGLPPTKVSLALVIDGQLHVPAGISDLESFRTWTRSEEAPENVRFAYLAGLLWVDQTMEQAYSHNDVKTEITVVLRSLTKASGQGRYFGDGMQLSNVAADFCTVPDSLFVSFATFQSGRIRQVPGRTAGVVEFEGALDMVLEVVSESSVEKDTILMPPLYHRAGITEFWRVDARNELLFEIFQYTDSGYVPTREPDGWWRSHVFGRSFRMTRQNDALGQPEFTLEVRP